MSILDDIRADRQSLADVLKKHRGIRKIVEDLYPDRAHFIYELLQNAEDAGATEASFLLEENSLSFEHNGRSFDQKDLWAITDIGEGTKADKEDKIGRFGVGFKAVFAYSETPRIWSADFSFEISELVLPGEIASKPELGRKTRFEFPFNNPKKSPQDAYAEIKSGLKELAETTLLFLSHLESICWQVGRMVSGKIQRVRHSGNHIEVLKEIDGKYLMGVHFLCFSDSVEGLQKQRVSVAFELDYLPSTLKFTPTDKLAKQLKVTSAAPGRVAVFFPAEKETSGLRFHLHAPFVPELSRASIKETAANHPLFGQLAKLAAASLHTIRELDLLTGDFLGVLPNPQDNLPPRYKPIRAAIIEAMNTQALTPTHSKSHAAAASLIQSKAVIKGWLTSEDLRFLVDYNGEPPQWAIAAAQKSSNADRFLTGLAIKKWGVDELIKVLELKSSQRMRLVPGPHRLINGPDAQFMKWLASKPFEWHQQLYALLWAEIDSLDARDGYQKDLHLEALRELLIIRLSNGNYSIGCDCYFPSDKTESDKGLPRVDDRIFSSGKNQQHQVAARELLEAIGVREIDETVEIEAVLKQRYADAHVGEISDRYFKDLKRFIALIESMPEKANIFRHSYILVGSDAHWHTPGEIYLDSPFIETGLTAYYDNPVDEMRGRVALAPFYRDAPVSQEALLKFAAAVGARVRLEIQKVSCCGNPNAINHLYRAQGGWSEIYGIDEDYAIEGLGSLLKERSETLSRLIWKTMCHRKDTQWFQAKYLSNSHFQLNLAPSQLIVILRDSAWIPQTNGRFVRPREASISLLPKGFSYDAGDAWVKEIHFGHDEENKSEESIQAEKVARSLGFANETTLKRARIFAALPPEKQERIIAEHCESRSEFPYKESQNPVRRAEKVEKQAEGASGRSSEKRSRSVSIGLEDVKKEAEEYLRNQYSNPDGEMFCQICQVPLPFKLDNGQFYFEKVEFLPELKQRHYQNYLALCPNHAAMFQHTNGSKDALRGLFDNMENMIVEIILARSSAKIRFTKTHAEDLRAVVSVDQKTDR